MILKARAIFEENNFHRNPRSMKCQNDFTFAGVKSTGSLA